MKVELDAADRRILSVLQEDGSLSVAQVGERIHLSTNACWRRMKRLEEDGYVLRRVALLDPERLGLEIIAYVSIRLSSQEPDARRAFVEEASQHRNVVEVSALSGESGYLLKVYASSLPALERITNRLRTGHGVTQVRSDIVLRTHHVTTALPIE